MIVICKTALTCVYKEECSHSKPHEIINNKNVISENNCILTEIKYLDNGKNLSFLPCYCNAIFLRKEKLENLKKLI